MQARKGSRTEDKLLTKISHSNFCYVKSLYETNNEGSVDPLIIILSRHDDSNLLGTPKLLSRIGKNIPKLVTIY